MKHFLLSLTAVLFLISCSAAETPTPTITKTAVSHPSPVPTATVPPPTATQTAVPIPTASATATPEVPTPTITAPTLTPLPTFAPDELETAVDELLADPMNCDVPCWWGAIPGKTTFSEIQEILELYQFTDYIRYHEDGLPNEQFELLMGYYKDEKGGVRYDYRVRYYFENEILKILISGQTLPLPDVIAKFGQPDEVLLTSSNDARQQPPLIKLFTVYLEESIAFGYVVDGTYEEGDLLKGCFANETGSIRLNLPNSATKETVFEDFSNLLSQDGFVYFSLEEVTDLTMNDFTQQISDNPDQPLCIEMPCVLCEDGT